MPKNLVCDLCSKKIQNEKSAGFSDREKDLDFCSKYCHLRWDKSKGFFEKSAQEWLDENYPKESRKKIKEIDLAAKNLIGSLAIEDWPQLEKINCGLNQLVEFSLIKCPWLKEVVAWNNQLTKLNINNCSRINLLRVGNNSLTDLNFLTDLNPVTLVILVIHNNNFFAQDLNVFSKFINLEWLNISNSPFEGSLSPLQPLKKLKVLAIEDTNITTGLEYLSHTVEKISDLKEKETIVVKKELLPHKLEDDIAFSDYSLQFWRQNQPYFRWLKEKLEALDPDLDVYNVLKKLFFNVKTGEFVGDFQAISSLLDINKVIIEEKEKKVNFLEIRIQELSNEVKEKWEKVHKAYLYCVSRIEEKELLSQLIKKHIEFTKFKKQGFGSSNYRKKYEEYEKHCKKIDTELKEILEGRLESEMVEETMNKVTHILTECEEIANQQLELEKKINEKKLLLEEQKKVFHLNLKNLPERDEIIKLINSQEYIEQVVYSNKKDNNDYSQDQKLIAYSPNKSCYGYVKEELIKLLIRKELKPEENIEEIFFFDSWFNENCVLIIVSKKRVIFRDNDLSLWLAVYETAFRKTGAVVKLVNVVKKISKVREKWNEIIEHFKKSLNSEHPATELYNNIYTTDLPSLTKDYENLIKTKMVFSSRINPNGYIRPFDIVKVNRKNGIYQHVCIYLGNKKVIHVRREDGLGVREGDWDDFLNGEIKIEIHHLFIPFKRPELIREHINIAFNAKYGASKYHLLKDNCEHFATLCVYGLGICRQKNINTLSKITKKSDYLLQAIKESNKFFENLDKNQELQEAWIEIPILINK